MQTKVRGVSSTKICLIECDNSSWNLSDLSVYKHTKLCLPPTILLGSKKEVRISMLHARTAFYTQHTIVASLVPTEDYKRWYTLELKDRLHKYLISNTNRFARNRSGPWKNLASDVRPEYCVAYSFKIMNFDLSDNKSDDRFEFEVRSDGIKLSNLSRYPSKHEPVDPGDFHHVTVARGCDIK